MNLLHTLKKRWRDPAAALNDVLKQFAAIPTSIHTNPLTVTAQASPSSTS